MTLDLSIIWPALLAGLLVTATHVPLGIQVLKRGIVFIDLAVAQIAGLGVIVADWLGYEPHGAAVQAAALSAALAGALLLNWTEKLWPEVQEAVIGVTFIVAANAAILLLATNPRGAEHLKDLLIGQILWVNPAELPLVALVSAVILALWFGFGERAGRIGFYLLFALATRRMMRGRMAMSYALGACGYALGLALSLVTDLPPGPLIVCTMTVLGI